MSDPTHQTAPRLVTPVKRLAAVALAGVLATGCGPRRLAVIAPIPDPGVTARSAEAGTGLDRPLRIEFKWNLNEAGSRVSGIGVARVEPPYKARLDLFLDNLEPVVTAALVGDSLRLPYGAPDDILPSVDLMWGTLGVFRPLAGTVLIGGDRLEDDAERLRYRGPRGTELHYEVMRGMLRSVELLEGGHVVERVQVQVADDGRYPVEATYRNLSAFRELKITRESLAQVQPFDPAIWDPRE